MTCGRPSGSAHMRGRHIGERSPEVLTIVVEIKLWGLHRRTDRITFSQLLDTDVVELLYLFHDELLFVDLDDHGSVPVIAPRKPELAEGCLELLWDINCRRLHLL